MNYTFFQINTSDSIGNTLSSINDNYANIDTLLTNIQVSAVNYWIPMAKIYESRKEGWKLATEKIKDNYLLWVDMKTTFETNSAKWVSPIIIWYPCILNKEYTKNNKLDFQNTVLNWLNINYPILSPINSKPIYVESQTLIVYSLNYDQDIPTQQSYDLFDSTTCTTSDQKACAYCSKCYHSGHVDCGNGGFDCGGCSNCSSCATVTCYFDNNQKSKNSKISAKVKIDYQNKYEALDLNALIFKVKNCNWAFQTILTTNQQ